MGKWSGSDQEISPTIEIIGKPSKNLTVLYSFGEKNIDNTLPPLIWNGITFLFNRKWIKKTVFCLLVVNVRRDPDHDFPHFVNNFLSPKKFLSFWTKRCLKSFDSFEFNECDLCPCFFFPFFVTKSVGSFKFFKGYSDQDLWNNFPVQQKCWADLQKI